VPRFANVPIVANIERLYREPVCRFLEEAFPESGIKAATWRRLFDHGWSDHGRGFVLLDGNAVVGFLGAIVVRRQVNGEAALFCNLSSWAVHAKYRGWGMALLAALLRDESLTYTAFTPAPISWAALLAQRFSQLGWHKSSTITHHMIACSSSSATGPILPIWW
jgi:acetoacetyl-CoA synthetase